MTIRPGLGSIPLSGAPGMWLALAWVVPFAYFAWHLATALTELNRARRTSSTRVVERRRKDALRSGLIVAGLLALAAVAALTQR